jgi:hypothetical protein
VIRQTIRSMDMVAIGTVVLTSRRSRPPLACPEKGCGANSHAEIGAEGVKSP